MIFTERETIMYEVMRAIYGSGIPLSFKGSMVLKACLLEAGYSEDVRHTADIDANWNSEFAPSDEQISLSIQKAVAAIEPKLKVSVYRTHGEGKSAGLTIANAASGERLFSMDVDVNRPSIPTQLYEVAGMRFRGITPIQILADKLSVISSDKVFRRIKDVVDIYYLSQVFDFDKDSVMNALKSAGRTLGDFNGFLHQQSDLQHAYEKYRFDGDVYKPSFMEVYSTAKRYIEEVLCEVKDLMTVVAHNNAIPEQETPTQFKPKPLKHGRR